MTRRPRLSVILFTFLSLLSLLSSCNALKSPSDKSDSEKKEDEKKKKEEAIPIRVLAIKSGKISHFIEASSTIEAKYALDIYPEIAGEVLKVFKEEGMEVQEGEELAELEPATLDIDLEDAILRHKELGHQLDLQKIALEEAIQKQKSSQFNIKELQEKLESAQTKFQQTQTDLERSQKMMKDFLISRESFESKDLAYKESFSALKSSELNLEKFQFDLKTQDLLVEKSRVEIDILQNKRDQAQLAIQRAQQKLQNTKILAPFTGILTFSQIQVGQYVQPSYHLYSLIDTRHLEIEIGLPERDLRRVNIGQPAFLFSETLPLTEESEPQGVVQFISPIVQKETGTVKVTLRILEKEVKHFRAGMYINVQIVTETRPHGILVPKKALLFDDNEPFIFLFKENRAHKIFLREEILGFKNKFYYEVLPQGPIQLGDQIIIVGQSGLKDQSLVSIALDPQKDF